MTGIMTGTPASPSKEKTSKTTKVFLYFTDVSEEDMSRLAAAKSKAEVKQILKDCMQIDQAEGFKTEILADMHYHNYNFCVSRNFEPNKTSTLLSIIKLVLEEAVKGRLPVDNAFDVFKKWLLKHAVDRPPWSVGIFNFDDVKAIMEYVHNTFFRHYRLYMYAFMTRCDLDFRVDDIGGFLPPAIIRPSIMRAEFVVKKEEQPELAHLFKPTEAEQLEAEQRRLNAQPEDKDTLIKRKVDEGMKKLMENFEEKLKQQDDHFEVKRKEVLGE